MEWFANLAQMLSSYEIADFVPYDAAAWQSLYAHYLMANAVPAITIATALLILQLWASRAALSGRIAASLVFVLATAWMFLGIRFHGQWHQQFNWAASYWEAGFTIQAMALCALALWLLFRPGVHGVRLDWLSHLLLMLPWLVPPLAGLLTGNRPVDQLETVALAPDPTAWLTLLIVLRLWLSRSIQQPLVNRSGVATVGAGVLVLLLSVVPLLSLLLASVAASVTGAVDLLIVHFLALISLIVVVSTGVAKCLPSGARSSGNPTQRTNP